MADRWAQGEVRSLTPAKLDAVTGEMMAVFEEKVREKGGRCEVEVRHLYPAINLDPEEPVVQIAVRAPKLWVRNRYWHAPGAAVMPISSTVRVYAAPTLIGMKRFTPPRSILR